MYNTITRRIKTKKFMVFFIVYNERFGSRADGGVDVINDISDGRSACVQNGIEGVGVTAVGVGVAVLQFFILFGCGLMVVGVLFVENVVVGVTTVLIGVVVVAVVVVSVVGVAVVGVVRAKVLLAEVGVVAG